MLQTTKLQKYSGQKLTETGVETATFIVTMGHLTSVRLNKYTGISQDVEGPSNIINPYNLTDIGRMQLPLDSSMLSDKKKYN